MLAVREKLPPPKRKKKRLSSKMAQGLRENNIPTKFPQHIPPLFWSQQRAEHMQPTPCFPVHNRYKKRNILFFYTNKNMDTVENEQAELVGWGMSNTSSVWNPYVATSDLNPAPVNSIDSYPVPVWLDHSLMD